MTEQPPQAGSALAERARRAREQAERTSLQAQEWAQARVPGASIVASSLERERLAAAGLVAGGLAYRLFLWLVPFGLVLAAVLSFWVRDDRSSLEETAREVGLGAVAADSAADAIAAESHNRWYFLLVGVALMLWFAMGAVRALRVAHALAWGERPGKLRRPHVAALAFTGVIGGLLLLSTVTAWLREELGVLGFVATLLTTAVYAATALWVSYKLPHGDAPWTALVPGAVLLALGAQALHLVVALYLAPKLGRSSALYGSLGAATVILLWLYLVSRLVVAAAFLNAERWRQKTAASGPTGSLQTVSRS